MKVRKEKWLKGIILSGMVVTMLGGIVPINELVVEAATEQKSVIADETSERSLTIWKYEIKDASEYGDEGTGVKEEVDKKPIEGIRFKIQRVKANEGSALVDPSKGGYVIDSSFTEEVITTDATGRAKLTLGTTSENDGIYLVTELDDNRDTEQKVTKKVEPFFVHIPQTKRDTHDGLIYAVEVQPKNILESLVNPTKTIEGGTGYSIKAGESFDWEATATIPSGLYTIASQDLTISPIYDSEGQIKEGESLTVKKGDPIYADYFKVEDTLNPELTLVSTKVEVQDTANQWHSLELNTDYSLEENATGSGNQVIVSLTQSGMKKAQDNEKIRVVYTTKTNADFNGVISNKFNVSYLIPGAKPVVIENPNDPEYFTGGFDIKKTKEDKQSVLKGAVFHLAETKEDAENAIFLGVDGKKYGKTNGTLADAEAAADAAGTTLLTSTSDETGKASFNGLYLDWYLDANGNNQQDTDEPTFEKSDIKRSYWVVETKAPKGFELLKEAQEVVVSLDSHDTVRLNVINKQQTSLPFTGGNGSSVLVIIALGAITLGAVAITLDKKKRRG